MLPKCVLPSAPRRGRRHHPTDINLLCEVWECGQFTSLWVRTKQHVSHHGPWSSPLDEDVKKITEAISLAKDSLLGKACQILTSSGLAPNTEDTWTQLSAKHPKSPPPVPPAHPPLPLTSPILPPDFNVLSILRYFPKASAAGPTGLRIQHLLDVAEVPVPTSICSLLRGVINLLASGQAPAAISQYMASGSLVALRKGTQDIRPITVGESLRRLTSKCLCSLIKEDASVFFQPFQFGVALPQGSRGSSRPLLVLHHLVLSISKDESCQDLLFNAWYLDDGVVAGPSTSVQHVVCLLQDLGPTLGLHLNASFLAKGRLPIASKRAAASILLSSLVKLGSCDPQIALILLRMCGGFTKLVHVARSTPPSLALDELHTFDEQAQLSLSRGGLGLRSLAHHSNAAFIASISTAGLASPSDNFPGRCGQFLQQSSVADKARLLSVSSPHASAWLSVVPSPGLGLSLDPNEHQMAIKWWLGLNISPGSPPCALCPEHPLDPLGHHAVTCKRGGDAISRHNKLRDVVLQTCHRACISAKAEAAGRTAGSAAVAAELRKHSANDAKCSELGWTCIPLVAESYGAWGSEAVQAFSRLASYLATRTNSPKSKVVCSLYGCLNLTLVRANAQALLLRCGCSLQEGDSSSL
ncbi:hypothetical protein EMCRGX_G025033 [Ephydatia muelleri]